MYASAVRESGTGWRAGLSLGFERRSEDTVLARRGHEGPLVVQKPFYPEARDTCHVYIVHPPGGVAGGDELDLRLDLASDTRAVITTPGAAKLYRSGGSTALLSQRFTLEPRAVLEWMPQETIVHCGAQAAMETEIDLGEGAHFAGWEIACLGLPASGVLFSSGRFTQGLSLRRGGEPLFFDRCLFEGGSPMLDAPWGLAGNTVCGLFLATLGQDLETSSVNAFERQRPPGRGEDLPAPTASASGRACFGQADGLLVGRYIGLDAWEAKREFIAAWKKWRESVLGRPACPPRIWNT